MGNFTTKAVWFDYTRVHVELNDGKIVGGPLAWYNRLQDATSKQRNRFEFVANSYGIHGEELDDDVTAEGFLTYSHK